MNKLEEIPLGSDGFQEFLKTFLRWGGLGDTVGQVLPLDSGKVSGLLPRGTSLERALDMETGGIGIGGDGEWMANHFLALRQAYPASSLIMQDNTASLSSPYVKKSEDNYFTADGKIYWYLDAADFTRDSVMELLRTPLGFYFFGFFVNRPLKKVDFFRKEIDDVGLADIAGSVVEVFMEAYDGEGYAIWRR